MTKLYLVTFSANPGFDSGAFHTYINAMYQKGWFSDWWHYTDNAYIVASTHDARKLYNAATPGMKGIKRILFVEINHKNRQGWLPADAWKWLKKYD